MKVTLTAKSQVCCASLCAAPPPPKKKGPWGDTPHSPRQLLHFPLAMLRTCPQVRSMEPGNPSRHLLDSHFHTLGVAQMAMGTSQ
jgi:hypothetical protein